MRKWSCAGLSMLAAYVLIATSCQEAKRAYVVAQDLEAPMYVTAPAGDVRLFIVQRAGTIAIRHNGVVLPTPFLDIRAQVGTTGEGGLLGLAFPSNYENSGQFYVFYSNTAGRSVLSRFVRSSTDPNRADPASERVLLTLVPPGTNHKGGTIAFSPADGYLYVGVGDGGNRANARDPNSLLGKMLRLDVSGGAASGYAIPSTNPFAGPDGVRDEIWAFGFRNPFRFSFDRANGDLWIGDVGENAVEEIDYEPAGAGGRDYGWPTHEGTACYQPDATHPCDDPANPTRYAFPVAQYTHAEGCSITGGVVSRGSSSFVAGDYLFADFCSGRVWALRGGSRVELTTRLASESLAGIAAISEDGFGDVYLSQLSTGRIWRVR